MNMVDWKTFWFVLEEAKRRGISVLSATPTGKKGRIRAERWNWEKGLAQKKPFFFADFASALRSFEHAKDSMNDRSRLLSLLARDLRNFQHWLIENDNNSVQKRGEAMEQVFRFADEFYGVRCSNLVQLKDAFVGDEELTQNVEELVDGNNWNAASAKIVSRVLVALESERKRLTELSPIILEKRDLLFQIWQHDSALAKILYEEVDQFGQYYHAAAANRLRGQELYQTLQKTLSVFGRVYDHRLRLARQALEQMGSILRAYPPNSQATGLLKKSLALVGDYQRWVNRDMKLKEKSTKVA